MLKFFSCSLAIPGGPRANDDDDEGNDDDENDDNNGYPVRS
jgi:hypothetical protein